MIHPVVLFFQSVQCSETLHLSWKVLHLHTHLELFFFICLPSFLIALNYCAVNKPIPLTTLLAQHPHLHFPAPEFQLLILMLILS